MENPINLLYLEKICKELSLQPRQVTATAVLLKEGATVPFIARYRKEVTNSLDEVQIMNIRDRLTQLAEVDARRDSIVKSLQERNLLSEPLKKAIQDAQTLSILEDLYAPHRPKKRTRATIAKEQGLEPLAEILWEQNAATNPTTEAEKFVSKEKTVENTDQALAGARDILAERISDDKEARGSLRALFEQEGIISSRVLTGKEVEGEKFKDYFDWKEPVSKSPSHRVLAMRRGEKESFLLVRITPPEATAVQILENLYVKGSSPASQQVKLAVQDCYKRLLSISMETEARLESKKKADAEAIRVFSENLRELLLASPLGQKNVIAIDPGFRTGCKVVILDRQGKLLHNDVIYPDRHAAESAEKIKAFCTHFKTEAIAIGNGTAGRETEAFVRALKLPASIAIVSVNESGASIYSASEAAREEFPDQDITVRGSVSIGRRLMDPLAELVKLDPKSIGVGQYQHDVDQNALKRSLDDVVMSCVNGVGVEVNTASKQLLSYVSGIGAQIADNIVKHRNETGPFKTREDLKKVPRLGSKAFEQAAGFLRIHDAPNPLDRSAVHPESYPIVEKMAQDLNCTVADLMSNELFRKKIDLQKYVTETVGLPTLKDIVNELNKPGRDPREKFEAFQFADGISKMEDLKPGLKLPGIVTNVTAFGAFVDIGVHQDGLVHISQLADTFVQNPAEHVKVGQKVMVTVMDVEASRKRIALSLKTNPDLGARSSGGGSSAGAPRRDDRSSRPPSSSSRGSQPFGVSLGL
ncbi:MAG: Tex family protein [Verrucomicrobiota bacterium]